MVVKRGLASRSVTWSGGGSKSATGTMYVYQEANTYTSSTGTDYGSWGGWSVKTCGSLSVSTSVSYSGGKVTPTASQATLERSRSKTPYTSYTYCTGEVEIVNGTKGTDTETKKVSCTISPASYTFSDVRGQLSNGDSCTFTLTCSGETCDTVTVTQPKNTSSVTDTNTTYKWGSVDSTTNEIVLPASGGSTTVLSQINSFQPHTATTVSSITFSDGTIKTKTSTGTGYTEVYGTHSGAAVGSTVRCSTLGSTIRGKELLATSVDTYHGNGGYSWSITTNYYQGANSISYGIVQITGPSYLALGECGSFGAYVPYSYTSGVEGTYTNGFTFTSDAPQFSMSSSGNGCNLNGNYSYTEQLSTAYVHATHSSGVSGGQSISLQTSY